MPETLLTQPEDNHVKIQSVNDECATQPQSLPKKESTEYSNSVSLTAKIKAAAFASAATAFPWHALELANKRWMVSNLTTQDAFKNPNQFKKVIFQDAHKKDFLSKTRSLHHGIKTNLLNRGIQYVYLTSGQQAAHHYLENSNANHYFQKTFGPKYAGIAEQTVAGGIIGFGDGVFMPLEVLKIRLMANPEVRDYIKEHGLWSYLKKENLNLYKATPLTVGKNILQTAVFFGTDAAVKQSLGIQNKKDATPQQTYLASAIGTGASLAVTNPIDLIKTRTQNINGQTKSWDVFKETLNKEGIRALSRGLFSKFAIKGTKQAIMFGTAEILSHKFHQADKDGSLSTSIKLAAPCKDDSYVNQKLNLPSS